MFLMMMNNKQITDSLIFDSKYNGEEFSTTETGLYFDLIDKLSGEKYPIHLAWGFDHFNFLDTLSIALVVLYIQNMSEGLKNNIRCKGLS